MPAFYLKFIGCIVWLCFAASTPARAEPEFVELVDSEPAEIDPVALEPAWETILFNLGLEPDPAIVSRATKLATVQSIDARAQFITPEAWADRQEMRRGIMPHPGVRLSMTNGLPLVIASSSTNLAPGDVLMEIGTNRLTSLSLPEALHVLHSATGSSLAVRFMREGETNRTALEIAPQPLPALALAEVLPNQTGYLKMNGIFKECGRDVVSQIRAWSETGKDGIVLDLRGAGGDDDAAVAQIASLYATGGQFLYAYRNHRNEELQSFKATEARPVELPLMVLVDANTHGAAETLAAILRHAARPSLLIGETTAGDFNLREAVDLGGELMLMTTRTLNTADGLRYNGQFGLAPDLIIAPGQQRTRDYEPPVAALDRRGRQTAEDRDAALRRRIRGDGTLERALDIMTSLKTLNPPPAAVSSPQP